MNAPQNRIIDSFFEKISPPDINKNCDMCELNIDFLSLAESAREAQEEELKRSRELDNDDKQGDISLKRLYGVAILLVLTIWVAFVITFMIMQVVTNDIERVSDTTLVTLLTSATANILILPTIVLKYLFPNRTKE